MGVLRIFLYPTLLLAGFITFLAFSSNLINLQPEAFSADLFKSFDGPFKPNERLSAGKKLLEEHDDILAPESLVLLNGVLYTGVQNGDIVSISKDSEVTLVSKAPVKTNKPSRILGIRYYKDNKLLAVDAYNGLLSVDIRTGKREVLLSSETLADNQKINFMDDVSVDKSNENAYFSDASTKWSMGTSVFSLLERETSGRLLRLNLKTGKTTVLAKNLSFANGVQLSHDGKSVLFSETSRSQITKYHLEGPKKGTTELFAKLPGEPDNIRLSPRGGYWVAMVSVRNVSSPTILDRLSPHPQIRKIIGRFAHVMGILFEKINSIYPHHILKELSEKSKSGDIIMLLGVSNHCAVVELDVNGNLVQSLQSSDRSLCLTSEVLEDNGHLYLASFANPYLIKVKL